MALSEEELKAQQQFYQRTGGPVIGQRSTLRTQPNKLFKESQQTGRIPSNFKSWAEAEQAFLKEVDKGVKPDKARKALGLTYQNVIGNYYFDVVADRNTGERRGFNPRAVNEDIHPIAERDLRVVQGNAAVDNFRGQLKDGWGDYKKKAAYDPMAISARDEATQVRNFLTSFLGRGDPRDQGMQIQRGHGFSASQSGGSTNLMDLWPELGHYNVHGHAGLAGNPRFHPDVMYEMNAAPTAEAAYYNEDLDRRGLTINPRSTQWPGAMMAADESNTQTLARRSGQSYSMGPAIDKTPGVSEAALPAQQRRRDELMAQMGASGPRQAINQANSMSIIMDPTQSIGTPVRVIQQGVPRTPMPKDVKATAVSPSGFERTIKTTQSTREELTSKLLNAGVDPSRVEQIVNKTRPFAKGPTVVPAPTAPTISMPPKSSKILRQAGPIAAGLGIATALLSDNPAEAIPAAAESLTPLGDIQGAPEPAITMVNVGGKLRPLNTDTNTLMDKPGYGLEQKGGQWREVKRGMGAATKQQQQAIQQTVQQVTNLMPKVNKVINPVGARITNEAQYFIVNPIRSAYDRIFGKRDI